MAVVAVTTSALPWHVAQASRGVVQDPQAGRINERVVCQNSTDQSYALYLPSSYSPTRSWPLVAAFDPGARGIAPVERFREAAELYGYIVCGSNNSRNGPLAPSAEAARAMLGDVAGRFSIDQKQVYLTGFSGGARAATAIAIWLKGQVAGVIGCGAGMAAGIEPSSDLPFAFYGTVGNEDFNYAEMKQLDRSLDSAGVPHRVEVFEGGHDWAPPASCVRAVEWMQLQAMKSGGRPRDDAFIDRLFNRAQKDANANESAGRSYEAYIRYAEIAVDFKGLRDINVIEKKAAALKDLKSVKQKLNKDRDQASAEMKLVSELFGLRERLRTRGASTDLNATGSQPLPVSPSPALGPPGDTEVRQSSFTDLKGKLAELKRKSEARENTPERAFARRVLNQFTIASFQQSMTLIQTRKYELAASNLALDVDLMPDNWRLLYNLACAYSLKGDKRRAIETLSKAAQKGFSDAAELERNNQLDAIREEAGFRKIVEALKQKR